MLSEYLTAALESAHFEMIDDVEPFYGHVPALKGVWATGHTLEECRRNLASALEDWVLFSVSRGLELPEVGGVRLLLPQRVPA
jgi:predicted RNase H-like HicB family nuclease